ncbi:hypothetical protein ACFXTH_004875 [Malus domestica]
MLPPPNSKYNRTISDQVDEEIKAVIGNDLSAKFAALKPSPPFRRYATSVLFSAGATQFQQPLDLCPSSPTSHSPPSVSAHTPTSIAPPQIRELRALPQSGLYA